MDNTLEIPGYKIKKELGSGGMSRVFLAEEEKLKRPVALKVLLPELTNEKRLTRRFDKEARIAARLHHSNIVSIYNVGKENGCHYIAMECLRESLKDKLRKNGAFKPGDALHIVKETAKALSYAHTKGFVHRDIKPDNIMFRSDNAVVLVDFGIVKALKSDTKLTKTGASIGTPKYMSPEQVRARKIDGRSDIYSLGIVLYEMLTGRVPYRADDVISMALKHTEGPIPQLPSKLKAYQPLIDKMLAKRPSDRVKDADGLIRLVDAISYRVRKEKEASLANPGKSTKKKKKSIFKYLLIIFIIAVLIAVGIYLLVLSK